MLEAMLKMSEFSFFKENNVYINTFQTTLLYETEYFPFYRWLAIVPTFIKFHIE
jgi:hypothetical protein